MPRQARVVLPGVPHHITHRGNNRQPIFRNSADNSLYLQYLHEAVAENALEVHAYCLMTNHIHLVITPQTAPALSRAIQNAHHKYALYVNAHCQRSGHLWQDRFYSCPLDDEHYWQALRYVECNPIRARIVARASDYPWSSSRAHIAREGASRLLNLSQWRSQMDPEDWQDILAEEQPENEVDALRRNTQTGRPLGNSEFIDRAEAVLGRNLRPRPTGRPRKPESGDGCHF